MANKMILLYFDKRRICKISNATIAPITYCAALVIMYNKLTCNLFSLLFLLCRGLINSNKRYSAIRHEIEMIASQVILVFSYLLMAGNSKTLKSIEFIPEHLMLVLLKIMYLQAMALHARCLMAILLFLNPYH
jgi:hypothetical protein